MVDVISIDYEKMNTVASQFEQESTHVKNVINEINNQVQVLRSGGWLADSATAFYNEMDSDVMPAMNRLLQGLSQASEVTRKISTTMQTGDEQAAMQLPKA